MARVTLWSAGCSSGVRQGRTPLASHSTSTSIPGGIVPSARRSSSHAASCAGTSSGSCAATSRNDSFACASLGMIVLPPAPV